MSARGKTFTAVKLTSYKVPLHFSILLSELMPVKLISYSRVM
jgi:hypothetical protein